MSPHSPSTAQATLRPGFSSDPCFLTATLAPHRGEASLPARFPSALRARAAAEGSGVWAGEPLGRWATECLREGLGEDAWGGRMVGGTAPGKGCSRGKARPQPQPTPRAGAAGWRQGAEARTQPAAPLWGLHRTRLHFLEGLYLPSSCSVGKSTDRPHLPARAAAAADLQVGDVSVDVHRGRHAVLGHVLVVAGARLAVHGIHTGDGDSLIASSYVSATGDGDVTFPVASAAHPGLGSAACRSSDLVH